MIISILSGKGGTGKTTIATNLAMASGDNVQLLDCDVEEPNAHLFIKPDIQETQKVFVKVPQINQAKCSRCGRCQDVCAFNAISVFKENVLVFSELCHGCGACSYFCPWKAIEEIEKDVGVVEIGSRGSLQFVHGMMNVGEAISVPIIKAVKKYINPTRTVILDAPPGTSCPVIETVKESDFCIVVTEPTPFGLNDLKLVVELLKKLALPFGVIINRCDLGNEAVEQFCQHEGISVIKRIPFNREMALSYSQGNLLVDGNPSQKEEWRDLLQNICQFVK